MKRKRSASKTKKTLQLPTKQNVVLGHILNLPPDIWSIISPYLGLGDLNHLEQTCKNLKDLSRHAIHGRFFWATQIDRIISPASKQKKFQASKVTFFQLSCQLKSTIKSLKSIISINDRVDSYVQFFYAIKSCDCSLLVIAKKMVEEKQNTPTLLHYFATLGDLNVIRYLIGHGLDINLKDDSSNTPLLLLFSFSPSFDDNFLIQLLKMNADFVSLLESPKFNSINLSDDHKLKILEITYNYHKNIMKKYFPELDRISLRLNDLLAMNLLDLNAMRRVKIKIDYMLKIVKEDNPKNLSFTEYLNQTKIQIGMVKQTEHWINQLNKKSDTIPTTTQN